MDILHVLHASIGIAVRTGTYIQYRGAYELVAGSESCIQLDYCSLRRLHRASIPCCNYRIRVQYKYRVYSYRYRGVPVLVQNLPGILYVRTVHALSTSTVPYLYCRTCATYTISTVQYSYSTSTSTVYSPCFACTVLYSYRYCDSTHEYSILYSTCIPVPPVLYICSALVLY